MTFFDVAYWPVSERDPKGWFEGCACLGELSRPGPSLGSGASVPAGPPTVRSSFHCGITLRCREPPGGANTDIMRCSKIPLFGHLVSERQHRFVDCWLRVP
jgi:hypothetical protein